MKTVLDNIEDTFFNFVEGLAKRPAQLNSLADKLLSQFLPRTTALAIYLDCRNCTCQRTERVGNTCVYESQCCGSSSSKSGSTVGLYKCYPPPGVDWVYCISWGGAQHCSGCLGMC